MTNFVRLLNRFGFVTSMCGAALWAHQGELGIGIAMWALGAINFYFGWVCGYGEQQH